MDDTTNSTPGTTDAIDTTTLVDTYLAGFNETDADARRMLITSAWAADGHYLDPQFEATGHDGLDQLAAGVHAQLPGHRFVRTTAVDGHHGLLRFGWALTGPDGPVLGGLDVAVVGDDGRLVRVAGFFGELAAA